MPNNKKLTLKEIWKTLRAVDTTKIEQPLPQNNRLTYISWADAWVCLMNVYPQAEYEFNEPTFYGQEDKQTCEVSCTITIEDHSRTMSLPVMTASLPMKSIVNPSSRDINDAQMRCLVKTMGMFGLGLYLWEKKPSNYKQGTNEGNIASFESDGLGV